MGFSKSISIRDVLINYPYPNTLKVLEVTGKQLKEAIETSATYFEVEEGEVKVSNFAKDVSPVSVNDIRLVDEDMAMKLGDKKLGEDPALGSVARLGTFNIQSVKGNLYWVAPLVHRDIIKWITSLDGTSGYVMVSASNPQDVRLVQEVNGKKINIVYQPDAYLHQDLKRHMYLKGYVNIGMTDFNLEIDDNGNPFWVVTLYDHAVGYSGSNAIGVATVNPQNGDIKSYDIDNAPKWIDRIQPEEFVVNQINDWGTYVKGFLNSVISEEGVLVSTEGTSLVYGKDGKSYWYTGITSAGSDDSTIGFMLVNTRTKEAKLYKQPGATETAAMVSASGKVQEKNYEATFPVMYNILDKPTYVISLKDKAGLVKMIAFVSVEDYTIVGIGESKEDAFRNYREQLKSKGNKLTIEDLTSQEVKTGVITRINSDVSEGNTYYYFTDQNNQKYKVSIKENKNLEVKIPAGVDTGNRLRLAGKGDSGSNGGENGDLYLEFRVKDHELFERDGNDIYLELPITIPEAVLGCKKEIPTLEGNIVLTIPAGSKTGEKHRIKDKGLKGSIKSIWLFA